CAWDRPVIHALAAVGHRSSPAICAAMSPGIALGYVGWKNPCSSVANALQRISLEIPAQEDFSFDVLARNYLAQSFAQRWQRRKHLPISRWRGCRSIAAS